MRAVTACRRYLRLLRVQLRMSALTAMQYRVDFLVDGGLIAVLDCARRWCRCWSSSARASSVAGWTFPEALLVVGWFTLLQGGARGRGQPQPDRGGRAHPQGHAGLRAAQARRRAVPGLDRASSSPGASSTSSARWRCSATPSRSSAAGRRCRDVLLALVLLALAVLHPLLALDPGRQRRVLGGEGGQPHLPVQLDLRRGALAGRGVPGRAADGLHLRDPSRADDHLPGAGAARPHGRADGVLALLGGLAFAAVARRVWKRALAMYTSASS